MGITLTLTLTLEGVKTIPDSDETYSEYYSTLLSMGNIDELLLFKGGSHNLYKPIKPLRRLVPLKKKQKTIG